MARLKRYHYAFKRLHEIFTARITAEPIYELKTGFSHHAYLCAEHVEALRVRVGEMREPPLGLEVVPDPALEIFFDEILAAPTTGELLVGLYEAALPALDAALARHMAETNPLTDAPSVRVCRFARLEVADMIAFGDKAIDCLVDAEAAARHAALVRQPGPAPGRRRGPRRGRRAVGPAAPSGSTRPRPTSTTRSPAATSGSRTSTTRGSTPRRSCTTPTSTPGRSR